jgi:hypothetical protein
LLLLLILASAAAAGDEHQSGEQAGAKQDGQSTSAVSESG